MGFRLRGATVGVDATLPRRHSELGLGVTLQRFIDLSFLSLAFGVWAEAVYHHQRFDGDRIAPSRHAAGGAFGGLFAVERALWEGLGLRLEGGPVTAVFAHDQTKRGVATSGGTRTAFTWWVTGGFTWRL